MDLLQDVFHAVAMVMLILAMPNQENVNVKIIQMDIIVKCALEDFMEMQLQVIK